ncbi:MAG: MATE efflux family protein [candidate division TM6 bacterium GW2011_GWE2_42_60]|nr:MAG: MATE efflux family protein [candidate division TM6 bacterium GW2011_GWE2_42_60]HBY06041.1 hypothetical protein [Candidatus Dependentiae bacterium]
MAPKKPSLIKSYMAGLADVVSGERYTTILGYFFPELITAFLVNSLLGLIDATFVGHLKSTTLFVALGATASLLHFVKKVTEGISVGTIILCGQYNGLKRFRDVGTAAVSAFWVMVVIGGMVSVTLYFGAQTIFSFYHLSHKTMHAALPILQLSALSIFLQFLYFALIGFLRGIKNTRLPMNFFVLGGLFFVFFDYALVFGRFGFPEMGLIGSAIATLVQQSVMLIAAIVYIFFNPSMRQYCLGIFSSIDRKMALDIIRLSWPVMIDKAVVATTKIWLWRLYAPMGKVALASFSAVDKMEQLAFVPALAFAQVITFLVSNDYGAANWKGIKNNIKKVLFLSSSMVFALLLVFALWPEVVIQLFDAKGKFTWFAGAVFPMISVMVIFDLLQVILAGALRGAANVRVVMVTRVVVYAVLFFPLSYFFSLLPIENVLLKFILIYSSFYIADGVMGLIYVLWFRRDRWKYDADVSCDRNSEDEHATHNGERGSSSGESRPS